MTDPAGHTTAFAYDPQGNLLSVTDPLGGTRSFTYDGAGNLLTATDENGRTTAFAYDAQERLAQITDALGTITDLARDAAGNVTAITEAFGLPEERSSTFAYDARNRITSFTDGTGATTLLRYDLAGNLTEIESPTGEIQVRAYDQEGRLIGFDDPAVGLTAFAYDSQGNLTSRTDAFGEVTSFTYDARNRVLSRTDALGGVQSYAYDLNGNLTSLTDERGNTTTFVHDLLDRTITRSNSLDQMASFTYDSRNKLATTTDPKGQVLAITYDALSRLTQVITNDNTRTFAYDPAGNLTAAGDDDSSIAFTYDDLNRLETAATGVGGLQPLVTLTNTYNALSERTALADSLGGSQSYAYDGASRLTRLTTPASVVVDLAYDPAGRLTQITRPNGVNTTIGYDPTGRLATLTHGAPPVASFTYGYDLVGNITSIAELTQTRAFAYDALERVIAGGLDGLTESYSYDALGNRVSSHLSASHVTDAANRLLEDDDFTYSYDANGNLTSKTAKAGGDVTTYTYNAQDQLTQIDLPGGSVALYAYDALGRRIQKDVDGTVTTYVYDGEDIVLEFDGTATLQARYGHGDRTDQPLVMARGGQSYHYHSDHLGSVRALTNSAGAVVNSADYDAYGNRETVNETVASPYGFTGREFDPESGLTYYRARYYDPNTGRFLTEDPIGFAARDANLYRYVFNNPIKFSDPTGLAAAAAVCAVPGLCPAIAKAVVETTIAIGVGAGIMSIPGDTPVNDNLNTSSAGPAVCTPDDPQGLLSSNGNNLLNESAKPERKRSLDDPESLEGATPEEIEELVKESGQFEPEKPLKKGDGKKFDKIGTKGSDQVQINKGYPNSNDPLHSGPYVKITKHGKPVRIPLAGNPALE